MENIEEKEAEKEELYEIEILKEAKKELELLQVCCIFRKEEIRTDH